MRAAWVLVGLLVWLGVLAAPAAAAPPSALYYSGDIAQSVFPFSIGADGSLSPIACSGSNCKTSDSPNGEAVTPNGRFLYVSGYSGTISVFAIGADGSLTPIPCSSACSIGDRTLRLAISPDGRFLYAPVGFDSSLNAGEIAVFAIGSDGSLSRVPCAASDCVTATNEFPVAPVVTPDGRFLYVATPANIFGGVIDTVLIYRIASDGTLTPVPCPGTDCNTGSGPFGASLTPDGRYLYVNNDSSFTVSAFAVGSDGTLTPIPCAGTNCNTGFGPSVVAVSPNGRFVYTSNTDGTVSVFSIAADGSLTPVPCPGCSNPNAPAFLGMAISPGARFLYTATGLGRGLGTLTVFAVAADGTLSMVPCSACATGQQSNDQALVVSPDQAPVAAFSAKPAAPGQATSFDGSGSSASPGLSIARYDWSFGDGDGAMNGGPTPSHTYSAPGHYTVTLTVTDNAGCSTAFVFTGQTASCNGGSSAVKTVQIAVAEPPSVEIATPASGAKYTLGQVVDSSFTCTEGAAGPGIFSCVDQQGRPSGAPLDTSTPGSHTFTATATSKDGLSASKTVTYTVLAPAPARVRITSMRAFPLRDGCVVEVGRDEREITAISADATCRHLRLKLQGTIQTGGTRASSASGTIQVSYKVNLPRGTASGSARAIVNQGRWKVSIVLPGVNLDPVPPSYKITFQYSG
ncbi:MAG: beta-propeller fold lactonase family protein, partial [Mycobacteriaceae bacterium]|nr:beta-propeller fold lactonase family protein [Mycobacteriaceae bacterium]